MGFKLAGQICARKLLRVLFTIWVGTQIITASAAESDAVDNRDQLAEVIVTARYRAESLQSTPLAITAVTGEELKARVINQLAEVVTDAPNVLFVQNQGSSAVAAFIRGIGQSDGTFFGEPGVALYIDDVYYSSAIGENLQLADIARVDVLRGPQGTLFGKNSEGGAIRVYSQQPTGDGGGYAEVGYGNFSTTRIRAAVDMSLVPDKLFFRVSGGSLKSDGYVNSVDFACAHPYLAGSLPSVVIPENAHGCTIGTEGGQDVQTGRAALRWRPTESFDATAAVDYMHQTDDPAPDTLLAVNNAFNAPINATVFIPKFGIPFDSRFISSSPYISYSNFKNPVTGLTIPQVNDVDASGASLNATWTPDGLVVKNVTAYREFHSELGRSPTNFLSQNYETVFDHQFTQELDVSGRALANALEWTTGIYYLEEGSQHHGNIDIFSAQLAPGVGLDAGLTQPQSRSNRSAFLHALYHFTDRLSLEAGYRYTIENGEFANETVILNLGDAPLVPLTYRSTHITRGDYKATLSFQLTDDVMTYAGTSTGFKAGGINARVTSPAELITFGPESVVAYELGVKSSWLDHRLRANLALFETDYKNLQQLADTTVDGLPAFLTINTGEYHISGAELELTAIPVSGLQLSAAFGGLHFKTVSLGAAANIPGGPCETCVLPYSPAWTGFLSASYELPLGSAGFLTPRLQYKYQGLTYFDATNSALSDQAAYGLLDGQLSWRSAAQKWTIILSSTNLTNKVYYTVKNNQYNNSGFVDGQPGPPRMFLASVRRDF